MEPTPKLLWSVALYSYSYDKFMVSCETGHEAEVIESKFIGAVSIPVPFSCKFTTFSVGVASAVGSPYSGFFLRRFVRNASLLLISV